MISHRTTLEVLLLAVDDGHDNAVELPGDLVGQRQHSRFPVLDSLCGLSTLQGDIKKLTLGVATLELNRQHLRDILLHLIEKGRNAPVVELHTSMPGTLGDHHDAIQRLARLDSLDNDVLLSHFISPILLGSDLKMIQ